MSQSIAMRLSMQGELRAWQYQKQTYPHIASTRGNEIGTKGEAYGRGKETAAGFFFNFFIAQLPPSLAVQVGRAIMGILLGPVLACIG